MDDKASAIKSNEVKRNRIVGITAAAISAVLYGMTPAVAKMAYSGGSNSIMMTFTRSLFGLPVLYILARRKGISLALYRKEAIAVLPISLFGSFGTAFLLYSSFAFINVGTATVLHFIFPVIVMLGSVIFFREKIRWWKGLSLALGFLGVLTFIGASDQTIIWGVLLALGSGFTYAGLIIGIERTVIRKIHVYKMAFYSTLVVLVASFVLGMATGKLNFNMTPAAWLYSVIVSMMVAVGAFTLLNLAILKCGATTTSIIALLEPLTAVLLGYLLLRESLTMLNIVGCALIIAGVLIISFYSLSNRNNTVASPHEGDF